MSRFPSNDPKVIYVVALPGTYLRVHWIRADGSIEIEQVVIRPTIPPPDPPDGDDD